MIEKLGGIKAIQAHVASLTEYVYNRMSNLRHSNGKPMLQIFGKHHFNNARQVQGGILNFEVLRPDGSVFSYKTFEREAAEAGFHVRTGAECNPGACYNYLGVQVRWQRGGGAAAGWGRAFGSRLQAGGLCVAQPSAIKAWKRRKG